MNSDAAYALVYHNRTMTELLLRAWLPSEVSELLDYSALRSESTKGYDKDGRLRTGGLLGASYERWPDLGHCAHRDAEQLRPHDGLAHAFARHALLRVEAERRLQNKKLPASLSVVLYSGAAL